MFWRTMFAGTFLALGFLTGVGTYAQPPAHTPPPDTVCPGDKVVWVNTTFPRVYYYRGERYFGNTLQGKFACEKAALGEGDRPTRNGQ